MKTESLILLFLLIALLSIPEYSRAANPITCEKLGGVAESIGRARDRGGKLVDVLKIVSGSELTKEIAIDAYKRIYLTPSQLSDEWVIKCYEATEE